MYYLQVQYFFGSVHDTIVYISGVCSVGYPALAVSQHGATFIACVAGLGDYHLSGKPISGPS